MLITGQKFLAYAHRLGETPNMLLFASYGTITKSWCNVQRLRCPESLQTAS